MADSLHDGLVYYFGLLSVSKIVIDNNFVIKPKIENGYWHLVKLEIYDNIKEKTLYMR